MARRGVDRGGGSRPTQHPTGRRRVKPVGDTVNGRLPSSWRRPTQPRVAFRCSKLEAKGTEFYRRAATLNATKEPPRSTNQSGHRGPPSCGEVRLARRLHPECDTHHKKAFCVCDSWDKIEIATPPHACASSETTLRYRDGAHPQAEESNEARSDDLRPGPRGLLGTRPGADPGLWAGRPEPRHGRALRHWQRPVSRLARPHHVHDDDDERCDAFLRLRRPPHGHRHRIASPLMARSSRPWFKDGSFSEPTLCLAGLLLELATSPRRCPNSERFCPNNPRGD